jgi:trigger factor
LSIDSDYKLLLDVRDTLVKKLDGLVFPDDFLKRWVLATNEKMTQEDLDKNYADMIKDLKWHLIKEKIVKANEIKVNDDDLMNFAKKAAKAQFAQYGMMSIPEEYLEDYAKNMLKNKDAVKNMVDKVVEEKVLAVVKSSVKLNSKEVSLDEFNKMFE